MRSVAVAIAAVLVALAVPGAGAGAGEPCVDNRPQTLDTTTDPVPAEVTAMLAVLRRPQNAADKLPNLNHLAALSIAGVNPDAIRRAAKIGRTRIYLVPARNVRYFRPLPDTEACRQVQMPTPEPAPGVCLLERATEGAATCSDVDAIRTGHSLLTGGGRRHGFTQAAGIVPDGVRAVIWRVHRGKGFLDTRVPVHNNVFGASVPGRAGHGLYVYWETAKGRKLVRGPGL
ncbi:MAG: hypothetical protein QOJ29_2880 [Thermoleophilaceae bacterium]|nr:hypothetical protein [Thermoleophilaceae bacterium]